MVRYAIANAIANQSAEWRGVCTLYPKLHQWKLDAHAFRMLSKRASKKYHPVGKSVVSHFFLCFFLSCFVRLYATEVDLRFWECRVTGDRVSVCVSGKVKQEGNGPIDQRATRAINHYQWCHCLTSVTKLCLKPPFQRITGFLASF